MLDIALMTVEAMDRSAADDRVHTTFHAILHDLLMVPAPVKGAGKGVTHFVRTGHRTFIGTGVQLNPLKK
jgi:hypothetical protein